MASRLVGHIDECSATSVIEPLADSIDEIVHVLGELLGGAHIAAMAQGARSCDSAASGSHAHLPSRHGCLALVAPGEAP